MERVQAYLLKGAIAVAILLAGILNAQAEMKLFSLKNIHQNIIDDYKSVKHISREKLMAALQTKDKDNYLIFDVREKDEFEVSHIKDAKLLLPSTWKSSFLKKYGEQIKGKEIIFYCSVGVRSTKMANYLGQSLKEIGAKEIYNLEEGIFGWANQGAPLYKFDEDDKKAKVKLNDKKHSRIEVSKNETQKETNTTTKVHPYNNHWGQLINDESIRSYVP
jgi:rhodanese-related sulfurtransferase